MKISRFNSLLRCYNSSPGRLSRKDDQAGSSHAALPINRFSASPLKNSSPIDDLSYDFFEQGSRCFCDSSYERPEIDKKKDFFPCIFLSYLFTANYIPRVMLCWVIDEARTPGPASSARELLVQNKGGFVEWKTIRFRCDSYKPKVHSKLVTWSLRRGRTANCGFF